MQRITLLFSLIAISASSAVYAQTPATQPSQPADAQSTKPRNLTVAPDSPEKINEAIRGNPGQKVESLGRPANVCAELVAFMDQKAKEPPPKQAPAAEKGDPKADQKAGQQTAAGAPPAEQKAAAPGKSDAPSGVAGPGQTAPPVDRAQQRSGISAPIPQDDRSTGKSQVTMEQAQSLAQANDLRGCQTAVRTMRMAGMALPPGLLALGALREDLLANMQPAAQQPAAAQPGSGAAPAPQATTPQPPAAQAQPSAAQPQAPAATQPPAAPAQSDATQPQAPAAQPPAAQAQPNATTPQAPAAQPPAAQAQPNATTPQAPAAQPPSAPAQSDATSPQAPATQPQGAPAQPSATPAPAPGAAQ